MAERLESNSLMLAFPEFVTQALPDASMAMERGALSPPLVTPPEPESGAPVGPNSLMALPLRFATHMFPDLSTANPAGPLSPLPV